MSQNYQPREAREDRPLAGLFWESCGLALQACGCPWALSPAPCFSHGPGQFPASPRLPGWPQPPAAMAGLGNSAMPTDLATPQCVGLPDALHSPRGTPHPPEASSFVSTSNSAVMWVTSLDGDFRPRRLFLEESHLRVTKVTWLFSGQGRGCCGQVAQAGSRSYPAVHTMAS